MEPSDDSNSPDLFDTYSNNIRHSNRNSMDSNINEDEPSISPKESKEEMSSETSRKNIFLPILLLPKVSVQEKIIICIENSQEKSEGVGYKFLDLDENSKEPSTHAIRNEAIRMFMVNKLALAKDTEFAIMSIEPARLKMLSNLTSNINKLSKSLKDYKYVFNDERITLDMTSVFSELSMSVGFPEYNNSSTIPPKYILRVILVINSSFLTPQVNISDPSYLKCVRSPCFFFDVLYLHEKQSEFNNVERIFQELGKIVTPSSYLLESSRDVTTVFNSAMKLLAHPNQRVNDNMWNF